jgi:antitoxin CptB
LRSQGFNVLRFWNNEVLEQTESVMERIVQVITPFHPAAREGKELERLRWRCRRGLLELDIVLGRFVDAHYATLDIAQKIAFDELLDMPDNTLWDMIVSKETPKLESQRSLLELIKTA